MAARYAVRTLRVCCPASTKVLPSVSVSSVAYFPPARGSGSSSHSASSVAHRSLPAACGKPPCALALTAPRRAEHHALQHQETQQIIPRYTDDIPAEYYKYGAFKDFKTDASIMPNLVRSGVALGIGIALCLLNDVWSSEHWHYKHRLAGSYLESD